MPALIGESEWYVASNITEVILKKWSYPTTIHYSSAKVQINAHQIL